MTMSKRVTVIVEGREYIVEVGDLAESPIKATVNQRTYHVEAPRHEHSIGRSGSACHCTRSRNPERCPRRPLI